MFNQFCYSSVRKSKTDKKKFSQASRNLEWPLLDAIPDTSITLQPRLANMNYLAKIGNQNRFPRDPYMLSLCSWKQEQIEGVGAITLIVENVIKELEIEPSNLALVKVISSTKRFRSRLDSVLDWPMSQCKSWRDCQYKNLV